jgi:hypothetical protein
MYRETGVLLDKTVAVAYCNDIHDRRVSDFFRYIQENSKTGFLLDRKGRRNRGIDDREILKAVNAKTTYGRREKKRNLTRMKKYLELVKVEPPSLSYYRYLARQMFDDLEQEKNKSIAPTFVSVISKHLRNIGNNVEKRIIPEPIDYECINTIALAAALKEEKERMFLASFEPRHVDKIVSDETEKRFQVISGKPEEILPMLRA